MTKNEIVVLRLFNQKIATSHYNTANQVTSWMGAIQAQDYPMAKWAIGLRLPNATDQNIESAFNKGIIVRTHVLRPTWHFVSADDVYWMLELTAPRIKSSLRSRQKQLGLTSAFLSKSNKIIEKALADGNYLTRNELKSKFEKAKIPLDGNRLSHLMMHAELEKLVCSGPVKDKQLTYALFDERVIKKERLTKEEALAKLAHRYFSSHGPATFQDFHWWSGLTIAEAKVALEMVKPVFIAEKIGKQEYWLSDTFSGSENPSGSVFLLPAFGEFIISYKDRSASIVFKEQEKLVFHFGVFRPIIVIDGIVAGIWKRIVKKDKILIEFTFFKTPKKEIMELTEDAAEAFGQFLQKEITLSFQVI